VTAPHDSADTGFDHIATILEDAARQIRTLGGTSAIPLPILRGVEAECDSNGQTPEEIEIMTPPTIEALALPTVIPTVLMTRVEVCNLLRVHPRTFDRWRADPGFQFPQPVKHSRVLRWRRTSVERWLAERAE
jgi:predicted DNA-binding transcriptional regulator AlpA